jgi:hypothetical protein
MLRQVLFGRHMREARCGVFKGHRRYAYFSGDKGQIHCSVEGCQASIRVNDSEPFAVDATESGNGNSTVIFFGSQPRIVAIAEKAKQLRVETRYFKEGQQVAIFDPADSLDSKCRNPLLLL